MTKLRVLLSIILAVVSVIYADIEVKTEQLNPADPMWNFKTIAGPSKSDIASDAQFKIVENKIATQGRQLEVLSDGKLASSGDDLKKVVFLDNDSKEKGKILIDLGKAQKVTAFWHVCHLIGK